VCPVGHISLGLRAASWLDRKFYAIDNQIYMQFEFTSGFLGCLPSLRLWAPKIAVVRG
jgi:hypothetical protein